MSKKLTISQSFEAVDVDLFGHDFQTVHVTRSAQIALKDVDADVSKAVDAEDFDALVVSFGRALDLRLKVSDGKRTKPSTLIRERWENDQLGIQDLVAFVEQLGAATLPR